jgi:hypothetical protein
LRTLKALPASLKAAISEAIGSAGVIALLLVASLVWILNIGFGLWRGFHDLVEGKRAQAALGMASVAGVNAVLGWMIYMAVSRSGDL